MKTRLIFLGPPGAGKGTQASIVSSRFSLPWLATGDMLRDEIARKTTLGIAAKNYVDDGKLVADEVVNAILKERLREHRNGFVLDGYPRTIEQAEYLDSIVTLDKVLFFDAPEDVLVERIINRRICPACNAVYNISEYKPKVDGVCDRDGTRLELRSDDNAQVASFRIKTFWEKTAPLVSYYFEKDILAKITASLPFDEVTREILQVLESD
ncbi:MAG: adenylate kinase [Methanomassiliicoccales archaeon]|nr:adenylate kinase [Methanomassiliicoccales archaeon]